MAGLGFVPSPFELSDLDFVAGGSGPILPEQCGRDSECGEQNGEPLFHEATPVKALAGDEIQQRAGRVAAAASTEQRKEPLQ